MFLVTGSRFVIPYCNPLWNITFVLVPIFLPACVFFPFYIQLVVSSKLDPLNVEVPSHPRPHVVLILALHLGFILVHFMAVRTVTARLRNRDRS